VLAGEGRMESKWAWIRDREIGHDRIRDDNEIKK
jgi:hypothetical protein